MPWPGLRTGASKLAASPGPNTEIVLKVRGMGGFEPGSRGPEWPAFDSEIAGSGGAGWSPVRPLGLELSEAPFDSPIGHAQLIVPGESALADRLVERAKFFDFLSPFSELAVEVLLALEELSEEVFDRSAGRGMHSLFEGECCWSVDSAKRRAA